MKTFFKEVLLPLLAALFLAFLFKPVYAHLSMQQFLDLAYQRAKRLDALRTIEFA